MKKLIVLIAALSITVSANAAFVVSQAVIGNTMTNLLTLVNGSALVTSITIQSTTATNANGVIGDTTTNSLFIVNPAYTNRISYATNIIYGPFTNYYGGTYTLTNFALIDITNSVASTTTPVNSVSVYAAANTSVTYYPVRYYFDRGIWFTNQGAGLVNVSIQYLPGGY